MSADVRPAGQNKRPRVLLINGPNLNMLGRRDPAQYGRFTLADVEAAVRDIVEAAGCQLDCFQSNSEGVLIDRIQTALDDSDGILINAGAYTHTSYALRDAIELTGLPAIEIHISDVRNREPFRRFSAIRPVCCAEYSGLGLDSYRCAAKDLCQRLQPEEVSK